jgi:hypothetical protein
VPAGIDREYRPQLIPRRGEWTAWGFTLLIGVAWLGLRWFGRSVSTGMPFLAFTLMLASLSISLSNWVDRQTVIRLNENRIEFYNGLRHARLLWPDIRQVRVFHSRWGDKVQVIGERAHFAFRMLGEVWYQGQLKGRMGFEKGDEILREIIESSGLKIVKHEGMGSTYARF